MKFFQAKYFLSCLSIVFFVSSQVVVAQETSQSEAGMTLDSLEKKVAYLIGYSVAQQISGAGMELDEAAMKAAMHDVLNAQPMRMSEEDRKKALRMFEVKVKEAQALAKRNQEIAKGQQFLAQNAKKESVTTLPSGVQYIVVTSGDAGSEKATNKIRIRYAAQLVDGTEVEREEAPVEVELTDLVDGLAEAIRLMNVGSKWQVFVPHHLAYPHGTLSVPPGAVVVFDIELLEVLGS
jgi:FKBP-type peptidyl-prolyl cis-trans isomerase FklB